VLALVELLRITCPVAVDAVPNAIDKAPAIAPVVSAIVTAEFCISLPVVVSNLAIALSVADAGPTTSPLPAGVAHTPSPLKNVVPDGVPVIAEPNKGILFVAISSIAPVPAVVRPKNVSVAMVRPLVVIAPVDTLAANAS
jgi:hypothetical protein